MGSSSGFRPAEEEVRCEYTFLALLVMDHNTEARLCCCTPDINLLQQGIVASRRTP